MAKVLEIGLGQGLVSEQIIRRGAHRSGPDMTDTRTDPGQRYFPAGRSTPRLVGVAWALLLINTLGYAGANGLVVPFPRTVGQAVTMGALVLAFCLALVLNPSVRIRPNPYLLLLSLLLVVSIASSLGLEAGVGALFRCLRFALFIATLWLLSCWWRGDLSFVRYTIRVLGVFLLTVLVGLAVSPENALAGAGGKGRLIGVLWPMHATQVGQYGAVVAGLVILLWLTKAIDRSSAMLISVASITVLLLSHTRTATIALAVALSGACLTLVLRSARIRRAMAVAAALAVCSALFFGPALQRWFERGQNSEQLGNLTGRQTIWNSLLGEERSVYTQFLGIGLSDKSFNGLSIDNSWLAVFNDQGFLGIVLVVAILAVLLGAAVLRPPSPARACAVFLILFCTVSSYAEVGLGDASAYLLYLAAAASLLVPSMAAPARNQASPGSLSK